MQGRPDDELIEGESIKQQKELRLEGAASGGVCCRVNACIDETIFDRVWYPDVGMTVPPSTYEVVSPSRLVYERVLTTCARRGTIQRDTARRQSVIQSRSAPDVVGREQ